MKKILLITTAFAVLYGGQAMACKYPHASRHKTGYTTGENVKNTFKEPCHSVVDCRKKGNDLPTRAMFKTINLDAVSQYPGPGLKFDGNAGGYVLKSTNDD